MYQIVHGPEPRSDKAGPLSVVLENTLVKDPGQRWTMAQVRDALSDPRRLDRARTGTATVATPTQAAQAASAARTKAPDEPSAPAEAEPTWTTLDSGQEPAAPEAPAAARGSATPKTIAPPPTQRGPRRQGLGQQRPRREGAGRRRTWLLVAAAVLVLVAIGGLALSLSDNQNGTDGSSDTSADQPSPDPSSGASGSGDTGDKPPPDQEPASPATDLRTFASDYVATATNDPAASWEMLTPAFQRASGGFESYSGFWSTNASATVTDVSSDPEALQVTYTVTYEKADGSTTAPEQVTLQLVDSDGQYLIADEL